MLSYLYVIMETAEQSNYKTVLSMNHVFDIIAYLEEHGDSKITDLSCIATNHPALQAAVMKMISAGLVTMEQRELPKTKTTLSLTPLGREISADIVRARNRFLESLNSDRR